MFRIPERHRVKKSFGIVVGELQLPVLSTIGRVVNARLVAGAGGHEERFGGGESNHSAEVESLRVGDLRRSPCNPTIDSAQESAVRTAGPRDLSRYRTHTPQALLRGESSTRGPD